ncbi:hypothetical protein [Bombiscardovia coagulans]|uniref:Uncharacterized protein n=1 Tax=Bombiscardovia coagulans TaxID=686666 RepID=A0A261ESR2_9BIFI|nr:hypothetical protein [Bombiscardovia coagulans]OZG49897.1 hypothetical protein BOCO_0414 [Bombiscardovia coagulans]
MKITGDTPLKEYFVDQNGEVWQYCRWRTLNERAVKFNETWSDAPTPSLSVINLDQELCIEIYTEQGGISHSLSVTNARRMAQWILEHTSEEEA